MATPSIPDDHVLLIVPTGARRTARILLPPETAIWLRDQLIIAIGRPELEPERKPRRQVRLKGGRWLR